MLYTRVNERQIRLTGSFDDKGVTGTAGVIGAVALVPVVGFFVTGTSAVLPLGGEVHAFIDEDVQLVVVAAAHAPMVEETKSTPVVSTAATAHGEPAPATAPTPAVVEK